MKQLILLPALAAVSTSVGMVSQASMLTGRWLSQTRGVRVTPQTWPDTGPARLRTAEYFGGAKRDKVPDGLLAWRTFVNAPIPTKPNPDYALGRPTRRRGAASTTNTGTCWGRLITLRKCAASSATGIGTTNPRRMKATRRISWPRRRAASSTKTAGTVELYNLADDIAETKNLALAYPEKVKELRERLDAFLKDAVEPGGGSAKTKRKKSSN